MASSILYRLRTPKLTGTNERSLLRSKHHQLAYYISSWVSRHTLSTRTDWTHGLLAHSCFPVLPVLGKSTTIHQVHEPERWMGLLTPCSLPQLCLHITPCQFYLLTFLSLSASLHCHHPGSNCFISVHLHLCPLKMAPAKVTGRPLSY